MTTQRPPKVWTNNPAGERVLFRGEIVDLHHMGGRDLALLAADSDNWGQLQPNDTVVFLAQDDDQPLRFVEEPLTGPGKKN
jgi:hypothetical protein